MLVKFANMTRRRAKLALYYNFWSEDSGFFIAEKAGLEAAVSSCGFTEQEIGRRMGAGFHLLARALQGQRLTQYEAGHVEWGLREDPKKVSHSTNLGS